MNKRIFRKAVASVLVLATSGVFSAFTADFFVFDEYSSPSSESGVSITVIKLDTSANIIASNTGENMSCVLRAKQDVTPLQGTAVDLNSTSHCLSLSVVSLPVQSSIAVIRVVDTTDIVFHTALSIHDTPSLKPYNQSPKAVTVEEFLLISNFSPRASQSKALLAFRVLETRAGKEVSLSLLQVFRC
ncbi:MAG TPA: hypothetical protein VEA59_04455 [Patescibacteria group bacterium]|nr:hypothetical protein [Patescibacteria group bacterium]